LGLGPENDEDEEEEELGEEEVKTQKAKALVMRLLGRPQRPERPGCALVEPSSRITSAHEPSSRRGQRPVRTIQSRREDENREREEKAAAQVPD
jgi:hypothetical protein